jgi:hypothetical protein
VAIDYSVLAQPKGRTRKQVKARQQRAERAVKQLVRRLCVERDGGCRAFWVQPLRCGGAIEWAHVRGRRRSQTRGMNPEDRHSTKHSLMLCRKHHAMEEAGTLRVVYLTDDGCDGDLCFEVKA